MPRRSAKGPKKGNSDSGRNGARALKVRVKTAKGRRLSSTRWLERQLNDPYVRRAKAEGLRGRAAFKLIELDDRLRFLFPGARVVDLGAAPGGWTQVAVERVNAPARKGAREEPGRGTGAAQGRVIGVDLREMEPVAGAELIRLDFLEDGAAHAVSALLGGAADAVLSDMAADSSGHRRTDHLRIMALAEAAAAFALEVLTEDGVFVAKMLRGGAEADLLTRLKRNFAKVAHVKPPASRKDSAETYLVATGFRGASTT